jgi:basic membrane protein A
VDHYIAGYKYCAAQVDPNVKVLVQYSNDFNDPTKCQAPADAFIKQKMADVIFQVAGGCGIGALNAAETDGVYGIGVDTDQGYLHPDSIITSATKHVDTAVFDIIDLTEQGKYPTDPINFPRFDYSSGGVGVAALGSAVPADVMPVLTMYETMIKNNAIMIPDSCAPAQTCASS